MFSTADGCSAFSSMTVKALVARRVNIEYNIMYLNEDEQITQVLKIV